MSTFKMVAVSNWKLFQKSHGTDRIEDYVKHLASLKEAANRPDILILREKELSEERYGELLELVWNKMSDSEIEVVPHTYLKKAKELGIGKIHLPFALLKEYAEERRLQGIRIIGTSVHSAKEAAEAEALGADYVTAGHVFATDCKPGLMPRGLEFLKEVCEKVQIPVYAIGGIHPENVEMIKASRAAGACMMSEYMKDFPSF